MDASIDAAIEALARQQHGAFSRLQALETGFTPVQIRYRIRTGRWRRVADGVYVLPGWPQTYKQRVMVATLEAGAGAFASHRCAAMIRQLDGVSNAPIDVTVPRRLRGTSKRATMHYSSDVTRFDWSICDGIPTASVTRIIVDLAADPTVSLDTLERIFEAGQRRRETSHEAVNEMFERLARSGKPGVRCGRELVRLLVDDGEVNHSELETRFFQLLRAARLPLPKRQQVVHRPDGRFAHADYAYDGIDGLIELLGHKWHSSRDALNRGAERGNEIALLKLPVLQFTWDHVTQRQGYVLDKVRQFLGINGGN